MRKDFDDELTTEQREKMKKNLVYIGIFSVIMLFAGLTSGYIVSMGDSFWVKYNFPPAFWISTVFLGVSSIVLTVGIRLARKGYGKELEQNEDGTKVTADQAEKPTSKGNPKAAKIGVTVTLILGLGFAWFQYQGYGELVDRGAYFSFSKIIVTDGRYGDYYQLKVDGKYMEVDGSDYLLAGKKMSTKEKAAVGAFADQLCFIDKKMPASIQQYGKYTLLYKNEEVSYKNGKFYVSDTTELLFTDLNRMAEFAVHLRDGRGDFFLTGEFGKDFHLFYKGKELQYKERSLYYNGIKLSPPMQLKLNEAADSATQYLYIITFLHLLHVIFTLFYMLRMSIRSFTVGLDRHDYLGIRTGAIFWHFLGVLWVYLLLFLLFIH